MSVCSAAIYSNPCPYISVAINIYICKIHVQGHKMHRNCPIHSHMSWLSLHLAGKYKPAILCINLWLWHISANHMHTNHHREDNADVYTPHTLLSKIVICHSSLARQAHIYVHISKHWMTIYWNICFKRWLLFLSQDESFLL